MNRSLTADEVHDLPSASKTDQRKEKIIPCHICERKKEKDEETIPADMYCYNCCNVFCDVHSGVISYYVLFLKTFFTAIGFQCNRCNLLYSLQ